MSRTTANRRALSVFLPIILVLLSGCGPRAGDTSTAVIPTKAATPTANLEEVKLDDGDHGAQVELEQDQALILTLKSNPTTGYIWEVTEIDESVLKQVGDALYRVSDDSPVIAPGTGGTTTWRFEPVAAGQTILKLLCHQPWEENLDPIDMFTVTVVIR